MDMLIALMQTVLGRLAWATLQSLPLAAVVWALCRWVPRLGANARCWLWWLVSLQLVLGLCWPSPLRLALLPAPQAAPVVTLSQPATTPGTAGATVSARAAATTQAAVTIDAAPTTPTPASTPTPVTGRAPAWMAWALWSAWLAGVLAMAMRSLADLRATRQRLRTSEARLPPALAAQYRELTARLHLRRAPALRLGEGLDSPQLAGVWSPVLLMPAQLLPRMSPAAVEMALHHELVHWQRRDLFWGWIPALAQHLFFFHPVAHLAAREYGLAREAACDAAVLTDDRHAPQDYGRLLLQFGVAPRAVAVVGAASPSFVLLKRRLTMLQSRSAPWRAGAFVLVAAIAATGVLPYRVVAAAPDDLDPAHRANLAGAAAPAAKPVAKPVAAALPAPAAKPASQPVVKPVAAAQPQPVVVAAPVVSSVAVTTPRVVVAGTPGIGDVLPPPPAPPMPPSPVAPVPPAPPAPAVQAVPPAPPAPPASPAPAPMRGTFTFVDNDDARNAWVLMEGNHVHAFGTPDDLRAARSQQKNGEALWWVREGKQRYVVRDAATLARLRDAYAPLAALSAQQSALGEKQGELGRAQGELGARQGELGVKQGEIATRISRLALEQRNAEMSGKPLSQARQQAAEREQHELARQMQALAAQQAALGSRQGALGTQQSELGKRQQAALAQLRAEGDQLARDAIASGKAQRL
ncbi:M56 family metallopeptidase [Stenotrophomonas sp. HITSZ_GD]|uniref:M56 family metallopeptidase n=1 Tax=Stenotrophomonas sp. HITSZ_GD TaxID=3037248 RepID=UPI00240D29D8|nr:M56 family metallopeptidase [Stenotrophomonas sp. HITSZ_GD]MDG2525189.1 M56 family metallopeptidase [Stenotrophomonas sp. HITSZ_GD]